MCMIFLAVAQPGTRHKASVPSPNCTSWGSSLQKLWCSRQQHGDFLLLNIFCCWTLQQNLDRFKNWPQKPGLFKRSKGGGASSKSTSRSLVVSVVFSPEHLFFFCRSQPGLVPGAVTCLPLWTAEVPKPLEAPPGDFDRRKSLQLWENLEPISPSHGFNEPRSFGIEISSCADQQRIFLRPATGTSLVRFSPLVAASQPSFFERPRRKHPHCWDLRWPEGCRAVFQDSQMYKDYMIDVLHHESWVFYECGYIHHAKPAMWGCFQSAETRASRGSAMLRFWASCDCIITLGREPRAASCVEASNCIRQNKAAVGHLVLGSSLKMSGCSIRSRTLKETMVQPVGTIGFFASGCPKWLLTFKFSSAPNADNCPTRPADGNWSTAWA